MNNVQELSSREIKKNERRLHLLATARSLISAKGLRSLKVRDVATAVDCSIGSIYNEFGDFDGLILEVNRDTFRALGASLSQAEVEDPVEHLHRLADRYLDFATEHANLLRALFEHRMEDDRPYPDDLLDMEVATFALVHKPLLKLLPEYPAGQVGMLARTLFSAVHGIISLGIEDRLVAVPPQSLRLQLSLFVDTYLAGLEAYVPEPPSDLRPER
jgi:AcrR family transcriptional regulator